MKASTRPRAARDSAQRDVRAQSRLDVTRIAPLLFATLAIVGLGISTYLTATHYAESRRLRRF
jgi:hypothetical protein